MLGKPTLGSTIALKRVTRYLKGMRHFVNQLELDSEVEDWMGFSDSDWVVGQAGSHNRLAYFSWMERLSTLSVERQSVMGTSSGMAEFYAGCATAEEMLLARDVLMSLVVKLKHHFTWTARQRVGSADAMASERSKSLEVRTLCLQKVVKARRCSEALSQNSCMLCLRTRSRVGAGGSHHDAGVETVVKSLLVHAHLPKLLSCLSYCSD